MTRTITALYDSREHAESARSQLTACGIEPSAVQIASADSATASGSTSSDGGEHRSFFQGLKDFFMPEEDRHAYGEGVRRGGYLLTARVPEEQADTICRILENSGAIDFDERQQQWRAEGWDGRMGGATPGYDLSEQGRTAEAIPVVDEQLRVGKREVERGGVRVRSYVEETPVSEQVELREEHVEVERRPVDQSVQPGEADRLFQERTIEATERAEEAVVAKEAVVREEIELHKDVDTRTETISDTVRHTEVDVDRMGRDDRRSADGAERRTVTGEPATFERDDDAEDDGSIAMEGGDGHRVEETEEERRERLARGASRPSS